MSRVCINECCDGSLISRELPALGWHFLLAWLLKAICYADVDVDEKHFVRVDVSEEFPFLVTKMSPYYDR